MRAKCQPRAIYQLFESIYDRSNPLNTKELFENAMQAGFYAVAVYVATAHGDDGDIPVPKLLAPGQVEGIRAQAVFVGRAIQKAHGVFVGLERMFAPAPRPKPKVEEPPDMAVDIERHLPSAQDMLRVIRGAKSELAGIELLRQAFANYAATEVAIREVEIANLRAQVEMLGGKSTPMDTNINASSA